MDSNSTGKLQYAVVDPAKVILRRWNMDLSKSKVGLLTGAPLDSSHPPGYVERTFPVTATRDQDATLAIKRSWDVALGPLRQVPMNLFIMFMTGNSISIFPIVMVVMMLLKPIQAIFSIQSTFKLIEGNQAFSQQVVYLLGNFVMVALALYKCHSMGLLPTYASDWLSFIDPAQRLEWSAGGMAVTIT